MNHTSTEVRHNLTVLEYEWIIFFFDWTKIGRKKPIRGFCIFSAAVPAPLSLCRLLLLLLLFFYYRCTIDNGNNNNNCLYNGRSSWVSEHVERVDATRTFCAFLGDIFSPTRHAYARKTRLRRLRGGAR